MCQCLVDKGRRATLIEAGFKESELDITINNITELKCKAGKEIKAKVLEYVSHVEDIVYEGDNNPAPVVSSLR